MALLVLFAAYVVLGALVAVPLLEFTLCGVISLGLLWFLSGTILLEAGVDPLAGDFARYLYAGVFLVQVAISYALFGRRRERLTVNDFAPLIAFVVVFTIAHYLCLLWPDFIAMGERLRDYALLAESIKSPIIPQEPWMDGSPLNYYVFWYRLAHSFSVLLGFEVWDAYHALAAFALASYAAAMYQIVRAVIGGSHFLAAVTAIVVSFGSNLSGFRHWLTSDHSWWGPSRVIKGAINEFPAWSFLLGDLHPHFANLCAIPLGVLLLYRFWNSSAPIQYRLFNVAAFSVVMVLFLKASNAWEVPMWAGFVAVTATLVAFPYRVEIAAAVRRFVDAYKLFELVKSAACFAIVLIALLASTKSNVPLAVKVIVLIIAGGFAFVVFPFKKEALRSVSRFFHSDRAMSLALVWFALALACALSGNHIKAEGAVLSLVRAPIELTTTAELFWHWGVPLAFIALCSLLLVGGGVVALLCGVAAGAALINDKAVLFLYVLSFIQLIRIRSTSGVTSDTQENRVPFENAFILSGLGLLLLPEFVFLDDPYGGENERMNTIFKIYTTAWGLVTLGAVSIFNRYLATFRQAGDKKSARAGVVIVGGVLAVVVLFVTLPFFVMTVGLRKSQPFTTTPSEEGLSEVARRFPGSPAIIRKLRELPEGRVLEAQGNPYDYTSFVSTLAGKRAYLGWANHVELLSKNYDEVGRRREFTKAFYDESDCLARLTMAREQQIAYVVVGDLERKAHPGIESKSFSCFMPIIAESNFALYAPKRP